jgi:hypothetical protein
MRSRGSREDDHNMDENPEALGAALEPQISLSRTESGSPIGGSYEE